MAANVGAKQVRRRAPGERKTMQNASYLERFERGFEAKWGREVRQRMMGSQLEGLCMGTWVN